MLNGISVGNSRISFAPFTECSSGNYRALLLVEKPLAELLGVKTEAADIGEDIKRAARLKARKTYSAKTVGNKPSSSVVFRLHALYILVAVLQSFLCRYLRDGGSAHYRILMKLEHR